MSSDGNAQIVQCVGCNSRLRVAASAVGKTIGCPKCGTQLKIQEPVAAAQPERRLVVAKPVSAPEMPQGSEFFDAGYQESAAGVSWNPQGLGAPIRAYQPSATNSIQSSKNPIWLWVAIGGTAALLFLGLGLTLMITWLASKPASNPTAQNNPTLPAANEPTGPASKADTPPIPDRSGQSAMSGRAQTDRPTAVTSAASDSGQSARENQTRNFYDLGPGRPFGSKVVFHRVMIARSTQKATMLKLNIFIPKGEHANQSLPVMFEAPSGTNLLHGADIEIPKPSSEFLPFTDAGMITVTFGIDGDMPKFITEEAGRIYMSRLQNAYKEFTESDAGVDCGKLAIDYVLEKVAAADPKRLYIWGHSSAATLSLLMASKDKRISKCIAMAPITDLKQRLGEVLAEKSMRELLPNLPQYFISGSPITYARDLKCPVFIAHAKDDDNEPFKNTQTYVSSLRDAGADITFEELSSGGHYQAMLNTSVPKAVAWLKAN